MVGDEAVVIIANPNGLICNGCGFINASRVDLVTGSNYNFNTDSFNNIENTNIAYTPVMVCTLIVIIRCSNH